MSKLKPLGARRFITCDDIRAFADKPSPRLVVAEPFTVTDEARELAYQLGVEVGVAPVPQPPSNPAASPRLSDAAAASDTCVVDAIAAVMASMPAGARRADLVPEITRRVMASLASRGACARGDRS